MRSAAASASIASVIGEGLKPLTTRYTPSENSQAATGSVPMADQAESASLWPSSVANVALSRIGAPMSPIVGMKRGTSLDRYMRVPSSTAFRAGMRVCPTCMVHVYVATCDAPVATSAAASAPVAVPRSCRNVTSDSRLTTPVKIMAASRPRVATKPSAMPSFCRLTTGNSVTAVPMPAMATITSRKQPQSTAVSLPGPVPRMKPVLVFTGPYRASVGIETKVTR